jgi:hypothetical protein
MPVFPALVQERYPSGLKPVMCVAVGPTIRKKPDSSATARDAATKSANAHKLILRVFFISVIDISTLRLPLNIFDYAPVKPTCNEILLSGRS